MCLRRTNAMRSHVSDSVIPNPKLWNEWVLDLFGVAGGVKTMASISRSARAIQRLGRYISPYGPTFDGRERGKA